MGPAPGDDSFEAWFEGPAHRVTITRGFWLGQTPLTQYAYERVMGRNPSLYKGALRPVEQITWDEAKAYCEVVCGRLPTEAEWEYAARAGTTESVYGPLDSIAWNRDNSNGQTHDVATRAPNAWGLYDMLGNVEEWVEDRYGPYDSTPSSDPKGPAISIIDNNIEIQANWSIDCDSVEAEIETTKRLNSILNELRPPMSGDVRVQRGGSWSNAHDEIRLSGRSRGEPSHRWSNVGLRCIWELQI